MHLLGRQRWLSGRHTVALFKLVSCVQLSATECWYVQYFLLMLSVLQLVPYFCVVALSKDLSEDGMQHMTQRTFRSSRKFCKRKCQTER